MNQRIKKLLTLLISLHVMMFGGCADLNNQNQSDAKFVSVSGEKFVDPQGRQILLHGINVVNKDPSKNYLGDAGPQDFALMREWGFNCIRLGIIWDGLEPAPGKYDDEYLQGIDQRIAWAKENGLYVILDMHQDLFSVLFSDGAPEWATLTEGKPHIHHSPDWSDAYFSSPAVQTAFDNFWDNALASDGVGIQDHYANAWAHVAHRYADETAVIGYDLMNEPVIGTPAAGIQAMTFQKGAELLAEEDGAKAPSFEELVQAWTTVQGRSRILQRLGDIDLYSQIIDVTEPFYQEFEKTKLMSMYQRVARAIRQFDRNHILFLETSMSSNWGVYSGIESLVDEKGVRDPLQAYAPHGYDLVTDTKDVATPNTSRVKLIFTRHGETAKRLNMPMLVGEWGAYGFTKSTLSAAQTVVGEFEKLLCSETYWDYQRGVENSDYFNALNRPYPEMIAGELQSFCFAQTTGKLECEWTEDKAISAPSSIFVPGRFFFDKYKVQLIPAGNGFEIETVKGVSKIIITPTGKNINRDITISLMKKS